MKYRIKAYHYKKESRYFPQWKLLWFWVGFNKNRSTYNIAEFSSKINAQKFIDDHIDKCNPKTEYIPFYEN